MIRTARPADMAQVAVIWNQVIRETAITFTTAEKSEAGLRATLAEKAAAGQGFLVDVAGDTVRGFALYGPFRAGPGYRFTMEHTIHLAEGARGKGLGRALLGALEEQARCAGVHSLWAGISAENPESVGFHARMGYAEIARLPEVGHKFGRWMDLVLMQKRL